ncbi:hypothetical protein N7476_003879 [Penicillium atrosanguineum]|uniref:Rhodopsin domain-containing protein n=1 Tax=Penicillium atrosanguineum TaxID=1132637 RepID=A0A9W9Q300_9EURO|nr:hypothetical protein N7476_003879 [Penicillium atrosanguineum]
MHASNHLGTISLVTQILSLAIISPLIALRAFSRFQLRHQVGIEDDTYSGGEVSSTSESDNIEQKYKIFYIATVFYIPMVLCVKTSLIYIFIRLWSPYRGKVISLYAFLIFIILYYTIILFIKIFTCNPIRLYWEVGRLDGTCLNRSAIIVTDSVVSVITDLAILIFPIALTWTMHMSVSKKLHVIAILGAGSTAIVFSIYRLSLAIMELGANNQVDGFMRVLLCDSAEGGLGLICTCIPAINKLFTEVRRKRREKREEKQRGNGFSRPSLRPSDAESASLFLHTLPSILSQES